MSSKTPSATDKMQASLLPTSERYAKEEEILAEYKSLQKQAPPGIVQKVQLPTVEPVFLATDVLLGKHQSGQSYADLENAPEDFDSSRLCETSVLPSLHDVRQALLQQLQNTDATTEKDKQNKEAIVAALEECDEKEKMFAYIHGEIRHYGKG